MPLEIADYRSAGLDSLILKPLKRMAVLKTMVSLGLLHPGALDTSNNDTGNFGPYYSIRQEIEQTALDPKIEKASVAASSLFSARPRFLIADDSMIHRKLLRQMIEDEPRLKGSCVEEASDGTHAVDWVARSPPSHFDCILIDGVMDQMHGKSLFCTHYSAPCPYPVSNIKRTLVNASITS